MFGSILQLALSRPIYHCSTTAELPSIKQNTYAESCRRSKFVKIVRLEAATLNKLDYYGGGRYSMRDVRWFYLLR